MKKSILSQFAADAINAPETVTGGRGGRTHARSRTHSGGDNSLVSSKTRKRTRTRNDG